MLDNIKPGSDIKVTVTSLPGTHDAAETIRRLMRLNPDTQLAMQKAKRRRARKTNSYIRAGVMWHDRPHVAYGTRPDVGASWTLRYRPQIRPDLESVSHLVSIEAV